MLQGAGREISTYKRVPIAHDDLEAHQICPMKERQLYATSMGSILDDQYHHPRLRAHRVLSHPVAKIILVSDIGLHQNN